MARINASAAIELAEARASAKQRDFQSCFFRRRDPAGRKSSIFVALGANRSGKSFVAGWLCFAKYLRDHSKDGDWFWCVAQTHDRSIVGQQRELWAALPRYKFGDQTWDAKIGFGQHRKIILPAADGGTCVVEFRSADQDPSTFEQAKLTGVWCDERMSETIYNRLIPRIIDRDGWILYSDIPEQWWQFERLVEAEPGAGVHAVRFQMRDNAANLPTGAIDQAAAQMTADERRQRIEGEFMVMEGVVYREFSEAVHVVEPFPIPDDWPRWRAIDYGGSSPTACLWMALAPNETAYCYREYYDRGGGVAAHARKIVEMSAGETYRKNLIDPHAYDTSPANTVTIAQQYGACGIRCEPWPYVNVMGEHAMVQRVKYRLERNTLRLFKGLVNCRREFRSWRYKTDKDGKPLASDAFECGNEHLLDCIKGLVCSHLCFAGSVARVYDE